MNSYLKIFIAAIILLVISILNEKCNIEYLKKSPIYDHYIYIFLTRFIHYFAFIYMGLYVLFFNGLGNNFDVYLFLFFSLFVVAGWYITDSCWLSYSELLFYNVKLEEVETTFHPCFYCLFNEHCGLFMSLVGILFILNVIIVLFYSKNIQTKYRIAYLGLFLWLFIVSIIKGRINKKYYDASKSSVLSYIKKYIRKMFALSEN